MLNQTFVCAAVMMSTMTVLVAGCDLPTDCGEFVYNEALNTCECPEGSEPDFDRNGCVTGDGTLLPWDGFPVRYDGGMPAVDMGPDLPITMDAGPDMPLVMGDAGPDAPDSGTPDTGPPDCTGVSNGTPCGESQICLLGICQTTRCGDSYRDPATEEACDDGNEISGDGCEPTCTFSCSMDDHCDDDLLCTGTETCDLGSHTCQDGVDPTAAELVICTREDTAEGVCNGGLCAAAGCGDNVRNGDEDCDDGNMDNNDGCRTDCTFTCIDNAGCSDGNACNGNETCNLGSHTCQVGSALNCNDSDPCTADSCETASGCVNAFIDGDGDGFSAAACTTAGLMGGDCQDGDETVFPGAAELCDGEDNDCDVAVDEDVATVVCRRDVDMDGYGDPATSMSACSCPTGWIPPRADEEVDCEDSVGSAHPGQLGYFSSCYGPGAPTLCGNYDYDCDGAHTLLNTRVNRVGCGSLDPFGPIICPGSGWTSGSVPSCGGSAEYLSCRLRPGMGCVATIGTFTQPCR